GNYVGQTDEDSLLTKGGLFVNDSDPDVDGNAPDDALSLASFDHQSVKGATVAVYEDGSYAYDPITSQILDSLSVGETTTDSFTYTVQDKYGATGAASVTITIIGVNDAPTAANVAIAAVEDGGPVTTGVL